MLRSTSQSLSGLDPDIKVTEITEKRTRHLACFEPTGDVKKQIVVTGLKDLEPLRSMA